jgi:putative OPT family oligopeptide transporter
MPSPYSRSDSNLAELSGRAMTLGLLLGLVMTAANTYLGLYAGMTVSASIPAAVVSMGILRGILRKGSILENNIVQTMASAGQSVAAGIIFTIPALVIAGVWRDFPYWKVTIIGLLGGVLGVLFMIPLRKTLIVEDQELAYPEGVACAKVLQAGESGGSELASISLSLAAGAVFKSMNGLVAVIKPVVEGAATVGRTALYFGSDVSVALLGVGVIVGLEVSVLIFIGGAIGWLIGIPLYYLMTPLPAGSALDAVWAAWSDQIRYMGVGAMIVGGLSSMWSIRGGMMKGVREAISGFRGMQTSADRRETDLNAKQTLPLLLLAAAATIGLYWSLTSDLSVAIIAGVIMVIASFFFVAVSSYIVGLVGSSNNPISGMTICALLFASGILLLLGMSGTTGILAALGIAGVVCCAAATAGDTSQDLKTGFLVGATPWKQQIGLLIGVVIPTALIAPVLSLLQAAYGIGTGAEGSLRAPQATLFASIAQALFSNGYMPWKMLAIGAGIAFAMLALNVFLEKSRSPYRAHVMPLAVGIYLPFSLSVPILAGGIIAHALAKRGEAATNRSVLISSGLIAGEAIAGIVIAGAVMALRRGDSGQELPFAMLDSDLLTIALFAAIGLWIYLSGKKAAAAA